jgi:hypothetical protein
MERAAAEVEMEAAGDDVHTPHSAPSTASSARVSIWESVRACGLWGKDVDKAELRRRVVMPLYARRAVAAAVKEKSEPAGVAAAAAAKEEGEGDAAVVTPMVVFVNSKSGGRHGPELKLRLHELISEEQVTTSRFPRPHARAAVRASQISIFFLRSVCFRVGCYCTCCFSLWFPTVSESRVAGEIVSEISVEFGGYWGSRDLILLATMDPLSWHHKVHNGTSIVIQHKVKDEQLLRPVI